MKWEHDTMLSLMVFWFASILTIIALVKIVTPDTLHPCLKEVQAILKEKKPVTITITFDGRFTSIRSEPND